MGREIIDRQLSACETVIMKAVWDYEGDIPLQKLMDVLKTDYHKEYARTTVATFLTRLSNKGFVETYRKGRISFTHPLKDEYDYKTKLMRQEVDFWFDGDDVELLCALFRTKKPTEEVKERIRRAMDEQK